MPTTPLTNISTEKVLAGDKRVGSSVKDNPSKILSILYFIVNILAIAVLIYYAIHYTGNQDLPIVLTGTLVFTGVLTLAMCASLLGVKRLDIGSGNAMKGFVFATGALQLLTLFLFVSQDTKQYGFSIGSDEYDFYNSKTEEVLKRSEGDKHRSKLNFVLAILIILGMAFGTFATDKLRNSGKSASKPAPVVPDAAAAQTPVSTGGYFSMIPTNNTSNGVGVRSDVPATAIGNGAITVSKLFGGNNSYADYYN